MSSASAPTDSVGSRSNIGMNAADAFARIHTPPSPVPTNIRPLTVGSVTTAVTRPVTPASAGPVATPPKVGISSSNGSGPSALHAGETAGVATSSADIVARPTASRSCRRICEIALRYASGGTPKFSPRRLAKNASRATRSRACCAPGALKSAGADREAARIGEDRITAKPAASSKPPAAANSDGEKRLDKAKTPLRPASSSHSTPTLYTNQLYNEYPVDYLLSIAQV